MPTLCSKCSLCSFTPTKNIVHNPGETGKADHNEDTDTLNGFSPLHHLGQARSSLLESIVAVLWDSNVENFSVELQGQNHPEYEKRQCYIQQ